MCWYTCFWEGTGECKYTLTMVVGVSYLRGHIFVASSRGPSYGKRMQYALIHDDTKSKIMNTSHQERPLYTPLSKA